MDGDVNASFEIDHVRAGAVEPMTAKGLAIDDVCDVDGDRRPDLVIPSDTTSRSTTAR